MSSNICIYSTEGIIHKINVSISIHSATQLKNNNLAQYYKQTFIDVLMHFSLRVAFDQNFSDYYFVVSKI